jgi:DNA repair exonuclease SbcCD ATPase subunit
MKIALIKIKDVLGIEDLEFNPGKVNVISGKNGTGKTSILEAIKAVTKGSAHDATLLRKGATQGEVVLVMDDGSMIQKRIKPGSSAVRVTDADGVVLDKPASIIKSLVDGLGVNPVDFLTAKPADRVQALLESMPIKIDVEKLAKLAGIKIRAASDVHPLALIANTRKQVYDDRTSTNRAVTEKDATINQLTLAMPDAPEGVEGDEDSLQAKLDGARETRDLMFGKIADLLVKRQGESNARKQTLRAAAQVEIDAIKATLEAALEKETEAHADTERKAAAKREETAEIFNISSQPIATALSSIRQNRDAASKRVQALETIKKMQEDLTGLQADAAKQTKALESIDNYKSELLAELPIKGLEVIDGEVYRDGIVFDRLNTAQQVQIAVDIAKLRAGELSITCVDRIECLDPETFKEFVSQAEGCGLQLFVTQVTGGDFSITT